VPAGQIQHGHARFEIQQPPDQAGLGVAAFLEPIGEEVEVVVVEDAGGVERGRVARAGGRIRWGCRDVDLRDRSPSSIGAVRR
jgi:hypothetical protein